MKSAAQRSFPVPPILLASIALQESSCIPSTVGGNGEQGLMQLTVDKCGGAPGGNCQDIVRITCPLVFANAQSAYNDVPRVTTSKLALAFSLISSLRTVVASSRPLVSTTVGRMA